MADCLHLKVLLFAARKLYCDTPQPWYMGRTSTITITSIILILPMCFPKRKDFLKYARGLSASVILEQERLRRFVITPIWFAVTLVPALFIQNIGIVISILGALAAVFIFIFPGMCLLASTMRTVKESHWTGRRRLVAGFSCCFIIVGLFIIGLTLAQFSEKFTSAGIKAYKSNHTC